MAGLPVVGAIRATSGQVIDKVHVTTTSGPCIVVPSGVSGVTITNSEIGPCGSPTDQDAIGIHVQGADVTIRRNFIHDMATALYAQGASHPLVFDRNYVTNIRGPFPRGQMVQFNGVKVGTAASKITCNVSDTLGAAYSNVEDHINMYDSPGLSNASTEIAYNRLRGGNPSSSSGSGSVMGDGNAGGGNIWYHHNTLVNVKNVGIGIAGGSNVVIENNRVYQDGTTVPANLGIYVTNYSSLQCSNHRILNNRVYTLNTMYAGGSQNSYWDSGSCSNVLVSGNTWADTSLSAAMFDEIPSACQ